MRISLRPDCLKRYSDLARPFCTYGRADLVTRASLDEALEQDEAVRDELDAPDPTGLSRDLESRGFAHFEAEPIAAASLGQVHRATLRDGRETAVKVQRPDIRERVAEDLAVMDDIAEFLDRHTDAGRRLFGYPGFALLFFVAAAGGGIWLAITILRSDRDPGKRGTR